MIKIAVIGAGTVGVLSVVHFLGYTEDVHVTCIHNPKKNILGIGESSTVAMPTLLWETLNFNPEFDGQELQFTFKTGVYYKNWRKNDFVSPIMPPSYAIHFDNFKLADVIFKQIYLKYKNRFTELNVDIKSLEQDQNKVTINKEHTYDYVIDCRGFPNDYNEYTKVNLPINHCLVNGVEEPGTWNFTYHIAHENGWMFGIPLKTRQGFGYLYNDNITSRKEAVSDFSQYFKNNFNENNLREYKFESYKAKNYINNRIMLNGNRALFYEPIEAISGLFYDSLDRIYFDHIFKNVSTKDSNSLAYDLAKRYENFISYIYHGGSTYQSNFWKYASNLCSNNLQNDLWKETKISIKNKLLDNRRWPFSPLAWKILDIHLYNNKNFN